VARTQGPESNRQVRRLETRERVYDAAVREFKRAGAADADIAAIIADAGVARGTFYFHFPTKEHVLAELTDREERSIADALRRKFRRSSHLTPNLAEVIRQVVSEEVKLGELLFRDVLAFYFSSTFPAVTDSATHPVAIVVIEQIDQAKARGEVYAGADAGANGVFFLLGLYALLATNRDPASQRAVLLDKYLTGFVRGLETR
jgi:AcrR family transcriptional regulator